MSKNLAIKGDKERGNEVIALLKKLGGYADELLDNGTDEKYAYFIVKDENNVIDAFPIDKKDEFDFDAQIFTLDEFYKKYPFKFGDFVRIPEYESEVRILKMKWCPLSEHIEYLVYRNDDEEWYTANELLEYNDNPNKTRDCKKCGLGFGSVRCFDKDCPHNTPKPKSYAVGLKDGKVIDNLIYKDIDMNTCKDTAHIAHKKIAHLSINNEDYADQIEVDLGDNYEYKFEMNRLYILKKKPVYPKTYEECIALMQLQDTIIEARCGYEYILVSNLQKLLLCRDAYWKIAGEDMGLGKTWKPDWMDESQKYCIRMDRNKIVNCSSSFNNRILAFPTEEMRNIFYENFKDLIEQCKELL
jgi:hypothetical protein